ncbi:MAG: hypothetical protein O9326_02395, partial [Microcystis sp. LE19-338.1B]|nr:hypothetical protein [Microcystis sp. LE19-338.1B]
HHCGLIIGAAGREGEGMGAGVGDYFYLFSPQPTPHTPLPHFPHPTPHTPHPTLDKDDFSIRKYP